MNFQRAHGPWTGRRRTVLCAVGAVALMIVAWSLVSHGDRDITARMGSTIPLREGLHAEDRLTADLGQTNIAQTILMYADLTGLKIPPSKNGWIEDIDDRLHGLLTRVGFKRSLLVDSGIRVHGDGRYTAGELKAQLEEQIRAAGFRPFADRDHHLRLVPQAELAAH